MSKKDLINELDKVIEFYNENGHEVGEKYIVENYNVSANVFKSILRNSNKYYYNRSVKKYLIKTVVEEPSNNTFMTLEELENNRKLSGASDSFSTINNNDLFWELLTDRLIQLNNFIKLNHSTKQVYVNLTRLKSEGYNVELI